MDKLIKKDTAYIYIYMISCAIKISKCMSCHQAIVVITKRVNLYIWLTISSYYGSIPLALGLIGRDGALSTLCHSCGFACQQRVLKTFPGPWLSPLRGWGSLTMTSTGKFVYIHIYIYIYIYEM